MKTDDLINALVADTATRKMPIGQTIAVLLGLGMLVSVSLYAWQFGPRGDLSWVASNSLWFLLKFVVTLGVAIPSYFIVQRMARPDGSPDGLMRWLAVPAIVLGLWTVAEFATLDREMWEVSAFSPTFTQCMTLIPLLSLAPLAAVLIALRQGAPAHPTLAGAFGGLLSGALGATLYATHCIEDSPFFVGIWYPVGIAVVMALGALIGNRILRW